MATGGTKSPELNPTLRHYQVFFIALSGIIGSGVFHNNGAALEVGGPNALIAAVFFIAVLVLAVNECISELVQLFPAPNAIVAYVRVFVDEDLGWVIGIAYWYSFASLFAAQNQVAALLAEYWGLEQPWTTLAFYVASPIVLTLVNLCGVKWFGIIETIGGALKVCLLVVFSIFMYVIEVQKDYKYITDGYKPNPAYISGNSKAVCYAIPLVVLSATGIEIVAVSAFEAKNGSDLQWPSRYMGITVVVLYILCTFAEITAVSHDSCGLPRIYGGVAFGNQDLDQNAPTCTGTKRSEFMPVIATLNARMPVAAGVFNACLIFSVLSAANTSLYVASRTLYGMARHIPDGPHDHVGRKFAWLSRIEPRTRVPLWALVVSALSFIWLPFLQLKKGYSITELNEIMFSTSSYACLIVWAALCLAFIQYRRFGKRFQEDIKSQGLRRFWRDRSNTTYKAYTFGMWFQPVLAWMGVIGCVVVFAFSSAIWWDTPVDIAKIAVVYAVHIILLAFWLLLKLFKRRGAPDTGKSAQEFCEALLNLEYQKPDQAPTEQEQSNALIARQPTLGSAPPPERYKDPNQSSSQLSDGDAIPIHAM